MANDALVSVIMPVYNCENYVGKAIESVLAQTEPRWELIIVDDGSKDGSGAVCDGYAASDERIHVYHKPNGGVSSARNAGMTHAGAGLIMFIDSDDMMRENELETALGKLGGHDLLIFGYEGFPKMNTRSYGSERVYASLDEFRADAVNIERSCMMCTIYNKVYRRRIISENGICFPEDISRGEDLLFNLMYYKKCADIKVIPEALYLYRQDTPGSLMKNISADVVDFEIRLKRAREEVFGGNAAYVRYSNRLFVEKQLYASLKALARSDKYDKDEKLEIMKKWLNDRFTREWLRREPDRPLKIRRPVLFMMRHGMYRPLYALMTVRYKR